MWTTVTNQSLTDSCESHSSSTELSRLSLHEREEKQSQFITDGSYLDWSDEGPNDLTSPLL